MYHTRELPVSFYLFLLCGLIAANSTIYRAMFAPRIPTVTVLAVGKGDAALVQTPSGKTLLIDTGSDASILRALGTALPMWQRQFDAVIITGTATSEAGGLADVTRRYRIPPPVRFGPERDMPYGAHLMFETGTEIVVIAPGVFTVSYGAISLVISSSTPPGQY